MSTAGRWSDLLTRIISAVALVAMAVGAAALGPLGFAIFVAVAVGCMGWELMRMHAPPAPRAALISGIVCALGLMMGLMLANRFGLGAGLGAYALVAAGVGLSAGRERVFFIAYLFAILVAGFVLAGLFGSGLMVLLILLIGVVIATDVFGYFAGRLIGGPKFWPRVSPKKTWAGVVAGWIAAVAIGYGLGQSIGNALPFAALAFAMSVGSQMGDIVESAMKRRAGVKDSSDLIPGHGGVLDRFDGLLGGALVTIPFLGWV